MPPPSTLLDSNVALLRCGNEQASAFFVTPLLAIAARHSVIDHIEDNTVEITLRFVDDAAPVRATLSATAIPEPEDIVFLHVAQPIDQTRVLALMAAHLPRDLRWASFGFPGTRAADGARLEGRVSRWLATGPTARDVELLCAEFKAFRSYHGFSGAPVVTNGHVTAVIQRQLDGSLGAISILKLRQYLDLAGVPYRSMLNFDKAPSGLRSHLERAVPNTRTFWALEEALRVEPRRYLVLSAPPGGGKTLIAAGFQPADPNLRVIGRYFANGDGQVPQLPADYYRDCATFAEWLSREASQFTPHAVAWAPDHGLREHMQTVHENMAALAAYCKSHKKLGIIFIDDPLPASTPLSPTSLLRTIPTELPDGLAVVMTISNVEGLRSALPDINLSSTISVAPLPQYDCERIARRYLSGGVAESTVVQLAAASGGNPLILSYLVREARAALETGASIPPEMLVWARTADAFYDRQWLRISSSDPTVWLVAVVARLRGIVHQSELVRMLPEFCRQALPSVWASVQHLVDVDDAGVRMYHGSFRDFVLDRTMLLDTLVQDRLTDYCRDADKSYYALANVIHHRLRASTERRSGASHLCTQQWLDDAAAECVPPAYVLADIEELLTVTLEQGHFAETIRLLLLRSRTTFRYNRVLAAHAAELSGVVLTLRNPDSAVALIQRNGHLICDADETVTMLRRLLLTGHVDHATELYHALRRNAFAAYEAGNATFDVLGAHIDAVGLMMPFVGDGALSELRMLFQLLESNLIKEAHPSAEIVRAELRVLPASGQLWRFGYTIFPRSEREDNPAQYCTELALILLRIEILKFTHGRSDAELSERPPPVGGRNFVSANDMAHEIESRCQIAGVLSGTERAVVAVLIQYACAPSAVESVATVAIPENSAVSIRKANGVDANGEALALLFLASQVSTYTSNSALRERLGFDVRHPWEELLLEACEWLGRASGRWYKRRRDGVTTGETLLEEVSRELLPMISFSLKERAAWTDAYSLPEAVVPFLLDRLADLFVEFEPTSIPAIAQALETRFDGQLGLYTEGYRATLRNLAVRFGIAVGGRDTAIAWRKAQLDHLETCVLNRLERVPALLECAEGAASLADWELAESAFSSALTSSLGPNWYKEDQFGILLETLDAVDDSTVTATYWRAVAEILELASGELTFQRFVRYEKQHLIRHLARRGFLAESVALLKHYAWSSEAAQEARIRGATVDCLDELTGSRFGVLEVDEQAGALALLSGLAAASPLRRWAMIEMFLPGDDRYFDDFAGVAIELLNSPVGEEIGKRLLRLLRAEFAIENRLGFARALRKRDSGHVAERWLREAKDLGILQNTSAEDDLNELVASRTRRGTPPSGEAKLDAADRDELIMEGTFGRRAGLDRLNECVRLATERNAVGDHAAARKLFTEGLLTAQNAGWGIWRGLEGSREALTGLLQGSGSVVDGLRALQTVILGEKHAADWSIAEMLIATGLSGQPRELCQDVLGVVLEHLRAILAPELKRGGAAYETQPLEAPFGTVAADQAIDSVLVSLLDHPNQYVRARVAELIFWLARNDDFDSACLIERIQRGPIGHGREIAAGILHGLALKDSERLYATVGADATRALLQDSNFGIRYAAEQIARVGELAGCFGKSIVEAASAPPTEVPPPAVERTWRWRQDTKAILEVTADQTISDVASDWLHALCAPRGVSATMKLWEIRRAAFGCRQDVWSSAWEREAVFRAVRDVKSVEKQGHLMDEVMWNPNWPEADLDIVARRIAGPILERIEKHDFEDCFVVDGKVVLHALEVSIDVKKKAMSEVEVVAVIVPAAFFDGHLDSKNLVEEISVHGGPVTAPMPGMLARLSEAAIIKFQDWQRVGGDMTPARPSAGLLQCTGLPERHFLRSCWRDGRHWDPWGVGPATAFGSCLLMQPSARLELGGVDLVWVVRHQRKTRYVVDPKRRRVYSPEEAK